MYESVELPCKSCSERGFPCGDKVFATIDRKASDGKTHAISSELYGILDISPPLTTPDDLVCSPIEKQYLQFFHTTFDGGVSNDITYNMQFWSLDLVIPLHRMIFPIASKALRYAVLTFAEFLRAGHMSFDALQYLGKCFRSINDAISNSTSFVDLVYASYTVVVLGLKMKEPMEKMLTHLHGFCLGLKSLMNTPDALPIEESLWMEQIWQNLFRRVDWQQRLLRYNAPSTFVRYTDATNCILQSSKFLLCQLYPQGPTITEATCQRLHTCAIYLHYYFLQCLLQINLDGEDRNQEKITSAFQSLKDVLAQIIEIGVHFNDDYILNCILRLSSQELNIPPLKIPCEPWQSAVFSLYFSAVLIESTLMVPASKESKSLAVLAALAVRYVTTLEMPATVYCSDYVLNLRNLFLAGLILTNSTYPCGIALYIFLA